MFTDTSNILSLPVLGDRGTKTALDEIWLYKVAVHWDLRELVFCQSRREGCLDSSHSNSPLVPMTHQNQSVFCISSIHSIFANSE